MVTHNNTAMTHNNFMVTQSSILATQINISAAKDAIMIIKSLSTKTIFITKTLQIQRRIRNQIYLRSLKTDLWAK